MKPIRLLAGCAFAILIAMPAFAQTNFRVRLDLGNAPPPPRVYVQHAPRTVWLPQQRVSVVSDPDFDDDYFQVGGYWYVYSNNYWYRARSWRGPFVVIDERYVPQSIAIVPTRHWRHNRWSPGRYNNAGYDNRRYDRRYDRRRWVDRDRDGRNDYDQRDPNDIWDQDGDGVPNSRDRYDTDPRRW